MRNDLSTSPYNDYMQGINPIGSTMSKDKAVISRVLAHKHMVETVERFVWKDLPKGLNQDLIERILYYRFKGALFNFNDRYFFLPFTLKGTIDSYGRYMSITPVLFTGQWKVKDGKTTDDIAFASNTSYDVVYELEEGVDEIESDLEMEPDEEESKGKAVILTDSTLQVSQDYTPMEYLVRPFIEQLTDILVLVNIDLVSSAKHYVVVATDPEQKLSIEQEFADMDRRILGGKRITVVTSATQLTELTGGNSKDTARYFQSYQSIDNLRKDIIGQDNGGTFMKQEHTTELESTMNSNSGSAVLNNALRMRQEFCDLANETFGLNISVELAGTTRTDIIAPEGAQTLDHRGDE